MQGPNRFGQVQLSPFRTFFQATILWKQSTIIKQNTMRRREDGNLNFLLYVPGVIVYQLILAGNTWQCDISTFPAPYICAQHTQIVYQNVEKKKINNWIKIPGVTHWLRKPGHRVHSLLPVLWSPKYHKNSRKLLKIL